MCIVCWRYNVIHTLLLLGPKLTFPSSLPRIMQRFETNGTVDGNVNLIPYQQYHGNKLYINHQGYQYTNRSIHFIVGCKVGYIIRKSIGYPKTCQRGNE